MIVALNICVKILNVNQPAMNAVLVPIVEFRIIVLFANAQRYKEQYRSLMYTKGSISYIFFSKMTLLLDELADFLPFSLENGSVNHITLTISIWFRTISEIHLLNAEPNVMETAIVRPVDQLVSMVYAKTHAMALAVCLFL